MYCGWVFSPQCKQSGHKTIIIAQKNDYGVLSVTEVLQQYLGSVVY